MPFATGQPIISMPSVMRASRVAPQPCVKAWSRKSVLSTEYPANRETAGTERNHSHFMGNFLGERDARSTQAQGSLMVTYSGPCFDLTYR